MTKEIPLTKGYVAIVDDEDYEELTKYTWNALVSKGGQRVYAIRRTDTDVGYRNVYMHREIIGATDRTVFVDHINHNALDNRRANLRLATNAQNNLNRRKTLARKSSKYKGVWWDRYKSRWCAQISVQNRKRFLGYFASEGEAATVYDAAARKLHGEFAYTNADTGS